MSDEYNYQEDTSIENSDEEYSYDVSENEMDSFSQPVIILDDENTSVELSDSKPNYDLSGASEVVDGKVEIFHLDDDGKEHTQVLDLTSPELDADEAREITKRIKTQTNVLYLLIARAHAGKAHLALGYTSFEQYIKEEFNYSKSYAYKLLDQSRVIEAIEAVMPEGSQVYVSDATARGLKSAIDDFVPELEDKVRDLPADEAAEVMEDLIQDYRERKEEEKRSAAEEDDELEEYEGAPYTGNGGGNGEYSGDYDVDEYDDGDDEEDDDAFGGEDPAEVRRRYEAVYNLYAALAKFSQMPPNDDIIKTIPEERQPQVTAFLETAVDWLVDFKREWWERVVEGGEGSTNDDNSDDLESEEENPEETPEY